MRRILLLAFACLLLPAWADDSSWQVGIFIARIPAVHQALARVQLLDAGAWERHLRAHEIEVLDYEEVRGSLKRDGMLLTGGKIPVPYADPRTGSYQVQYVDTGLKMFAKPQEVANGRLLLDCRIDRSAPTTTTGLPEQEGLVCQTSLLIKPGQVAILASTHGRFSAQYAKRSYPKDVFSENDSLVVAISVRRF